MLIEIQNHEEWTKRCLILLLQDTSMCHSFVYSDKFCNVKLHFTSFIE